MPPAATSGLTPPVVLVGVPLAASHVVQPIVNTAYTGASLIGQFVVTVVAAGAGLAITNASVSGWAGGPEIWDSVDEPTPLGDPPLSSAPIVVSTERVLRSGIASSLPATPLLLLVFDIATGAGAQWASTLSSLIKVGGTDDAFRKDRTGYTSFTDVVTLVSKVDFVEQEKIEES